MITTPRPEPTNALRYAWNPSSAPLCPKASSSGSTAKPRPKSSAWGVNIWRVIACDSTRLDLPACASDTSIATLARSEGVVHNPAAAISG